MSDELVYVVNENDFIIGKERKLLCHDKGLLHRISGVLIFNSQEKLLLQKRAKGKIGEGLIDYSASGHVSLNESYEETAYRELEEELGIKTDLRLLYTKLIEIFDYPKGAKIHHIVNVYTGIYDGDFNMSRFIFCVNSLLQYVMKQKINLDHAQEPDTHHTLKCMVLDIQKEELESINLYSLGRVKKILKENPEYMTEALKLSLIKMLK